MTLERSDILMVLGMVIFVPAFMFQVFKLFKGGKHTIGIVASSWLMNFIGRYLWIIYGFLIGSLVSDNGVQKSLFSGNVILFGQSIITILTISMLYYSFRNINNFGAYKKELFKKRLFVSRLLLDVFVLTSVLVFGLALNGVIYIPTHKVTALVISIIATSFTGMAFLPQGIKVIKTKNTKSTSIYLSTLFAMGNTLLIISLMVKIFDHNELLISNIGGIILPIISTSMMYIISFVKLSNILAKKEK